MYYELAPYPMALFDQDTLRKTEKSKIYDLCQNDKIEFDHVTVPDYSA